MSTYKVIQDIEAEDKLLGPLTLRQFIFAIIAAANYYICFLALTRGAYFLLLIFLPPAFVGTFFAFPWGKDQPTEIWALAKIRFLFKPRKRIWDQSGMKDLVTITAPKKIAEPPRTDGLSQHEVKSRLNALANTIDSRGWAIKNVNVNLNAQSGLRASSTQTDRLLDASNFPQDVPNYDVQAADDILDEQNNPIAHQFDKMITVSAQNRRQQLMDMVQSKSTITLPAPIEATPRSVPAANATQAPPNDYWFLNQPVAPPSPNTQTLSTAPVVNPGTDDQTGVVQAAEPTADEKAISARIKAEHAQPQPSYTHMKNIRPLGDQQATPAAPIAPPKPEPKPENVNLAPRNDLNISTLARIANKEDSLDDNEVIIPLH